MWGADCPYNIPTHQALLRLARVCGCSLTDKKWAWFCINQVSNTVWREDALERLELKKAIKDVIKALLVAHLNHKPTQGVSRAVTAITK